MSESAKTGVLDQLAALGKQNGATWAESSANGNLGVAEDGPDGKMHATIRINEDELVFDPTVLVLPHGGDLEISSSTTTRTRTALSCRAMATPSFSGWSTIRTEPPTSPGRPGLLLVRVDHWQR